MEIKRIVTGFLDENCYVLIKNKTCLVIDPGDDFPKIKKEIGDNKILAVLITHSHFDHIGALRNFLTKKSIKIFKKSNLEEKEYTIGDFSIGRTDLPGGSNEEMQESIRKILAFDDKIKLYPGHNDETTLKYEKSHNPFLK